MLREGRSRLRRLARVARSAPGEIRKVGSVRAWAFYLPGPGPWLMSWLRKQWVLFRNPHAHIEFRGPVYLGPGFSLDMPRGGTFIVGPGVEFRRGFRADLGPDARIEIGTLCAFTYDVIMSCHTSIVVGDRAIMGQNTYIVDGNHRYRDLDRPFLDQGYEYRPITIGPGAVVHSKCTIVHDIGERAIIGANAVVSRPVPAFCVAAGVPARVLDYFGPPGQEPPELAARSESSTATPG
jgi:acetyltransferase-like isoleucine patch superfamily enzyme